MALFDELGIDLPLATRRVTQRGFASTAQLTPEEEDSLLSYFAGGGLSALEAIGNVLDTPGSFIRTALAGENPFPAIFDTTKRVSGRDLLEEWGMLGPNQVGTLDAGDVAGFAAEMVTDPLTYLTFGTSAALKPAGQIAKAIGKLPKRSLLNPLTGAVEQGVRATRLAPDGLGAILRQTPDLVEPARRAATAMGYNLDDVLAEGGALSGQIGFGLPFRDPAMTFNLPYAKQFAGGLDAAGAFVKTSRPGVVASRLFDSAVRGAATPQVQEALRGVTDTTDPLRSMLQTEEGLRYYDIEKNLPDMLTPEGQYDHRKLWDLIEGRDYNFQAQPKPLSVGATVDRVFPKASAEQRQFAVDMVTDLRARYEQNLTGLQELGYADKPYNMPFSGTAYTHRVATDPDYLPGGGKSSERFVTDDPFGGRTIHAPTSLVNDVLNDQKLHDLAKGLPQKDVMAEATEGQIERLVDLDYLDTDDLVQLQAAKMIRMGETGQEIDRAVFLKPPPPYLRQKVVDQALTHFGWGPVEKKYFAELKKLKKEAIETGDPTIFSDIQSANLDGMQFQVKQAKMLSRMNLARDDELLAAAKDFYSHDALRDFTRKQLGDMERLEYGKQVQDLFAGMATPGVPGLATPGMVKIADALKMMGMGGDLATQPAAVRSIAQRLFNAGKLTDDQLKLIVDQHAVADNGLAVLSGFEISENIATDAAGFMSRMNAPQETKGLLGLYDKWLNNFKANVTAPFPSFHSRNVVSLFWQNLVGGGRDPRYAVFDPRAYSQPFADVNKLLHGKDIPDAHTLPIFAGRTLTPHQASNELRAIFAGHGVAMGQGTLSSEATELLGGRGAVMAEGDISLRLPGQKPMDPGPLGAKYAVEGIRKFFSKEGWNPLRTAGGPLGDEVDKFAPVAAGRKAATYFEDLGRGATMLAKLRQGYLPDAASAISQAAHVDYRRIRYSPFESNVMKRLVPFYTFSKGAIPYALRDLMQHPGGFNAQAVRLFNSARDERGFLPPQVEGGLAVPIGEEQNGMQKYLAKIDLPIESLNDFARITPSLTGTVETGLRGMIAQATPALKTPIEMAFGKSSYQGRNLDRLDPLLGRIASNVTGEQYPYQIPGDTLLDAILMASPVSRYLTTTRQLTDTRKGIGEKAVNFFSGARLTDVDVEKSRMFAAQDVIEKMLKENPAVREYSRVYVPADQKANLTPEEAAALQIYQLIGQRLKERAEANSALAP